MVVPTGLRDFDSEAGVHQSSFTGESSIRRYVQSDNTHTIAGWDRQMITTHHGIYATRLAATLSYYKWSITKSKKGVEEVLYYVQ